MSKEPQKVGNVLQAATLVSIIIGISLIFVEVGRRDEALSNMQSDQRELGEIVQDLSNVVTANSTAGTVNGARLEELTVQFRDISARLRALEQGG